MSTSKSMKVKIKKESLDEELLDEKMIFDGTSNKTTMDVWRVQRKFKRGTLGPHRIYNSDFDLNKKGEAEMDAIRKLTSKYGMDKKRSPSPEKDFSPEDWDRRNTITKNKKSPPEEWFQKKFGFPSPEAAEAWFTKRGLEKLAEVGFKLEKVKAKKVWLSKSGKQLIYIPAK